MDRYGDKIKFDLPDHLQLYSREDYHQPFILNLLQKQLLDGQTKFGGLVAFYRSLPVLAQKAVEQAAYQYQIKYGNTPIKENFYFYLLNNLIYKPKTATTSKPSSLLDCTKLSIGMLSDNLEIDFSQFPNLKKLEINLSTASTKKISETCAQLRRYCPKLTYLVLPESMQEQGNLLPYTITYEKYPDFDFSEQVEANYDDRNVNYKPTQKVDKQYSQGRPYSPDLYIADNGLSELTQKTDRKNTYRMVKAGTILNHSANQARRIRTGIIELSNDFSRQHYRSATLKSMPLPKQVTDNLVYDCSKKLNADYYHFTESIPANKKVRLLSIDAQEKIIALTAKRADIKCYRGDDDFYYVEASHDCQLDFILEAPHMGDSYSKLKNDTSIRNIIGQFYSHPNFKLESTHNQIKKDNESYADWFDRLYNNPWGSCYERCLGIWYQFYKDPTLRDRVRMIGIDNNHVVLEIKASDNLWYQFDFGGKEAKLEFDNQNIYKPEIEEVRHVERSETSPASREIPRSARDDVFLSRDDVFIHRYEQLKNKVQKKRNPKLISDFETEFQSKASPELIISSNPQQATNEFLKQAKTLGYSVFVLHHPDQIRFHKDQIHLETNPPQILKKDSFDLFLEENQNNPKALLLIDWSAFTPQEKVAYNSILEKQQSLYGKTFSLKTFSLVNEIPKDSAFLSRHKKVLKLAISVAGKVDEPDNTKTIDIKGLPDWQEVLFGEIGLHLNKLDWQPSDLSRLGLGPTQWDVGPRPNLRTQIILTNVPIEEQAKVKSFLERSKAQGFFEYHHLKIPIPAEYTFKMDSSPFNFIQFQAQNCYQNVQLDKVPEDAKLVNTTVFDFLLTQKEISEGIYHKGQGWLEQHAGQSLNLFITSSLSLSQWYCLINRAQAHQVNLSFYLSEDVKLPPQLKHKDLKVTSSKMNLENTQPSVIISEDPKNAFKHDEEAYVFAIEDYSYQDIVKWVDFKRKDQQFCNFEEKTSQLFTDLNSGKTVILYGDFSTAMLQSLQPILQEQYQGKLKGKLILSMNKANGAEMNFLPASEIQNLSLDKPKKAEALIVYAEQADEDQSLDNAEEKAKAFITKRLDVLAQSIKEHAITHLEGPTGVGKSFLMKELQKTHGDEFEIIYEFENFEELTKPSSGKMKVLFLDEVNIADKHLTILNPLLEGGNPDILYKGKIYHFNENEIRVVCASNDIDYGGGRVKQKLFDQSGIAKIGLSQIPNYFIYERMLKPIYARVQPYMEEEQFKKQCEVFLNQYNKQQHNKPEEVTIRDLQEWVVTDVMQRVKDQPQRFFKIYKVAKPEIQTDIVITTSMKPLHKKLRRAIEVRKQQFLENSQPVLGKNGVLIEGKPGTGKSKLVEYRLHRSGYIRAIPGEKAPGNNQLSYIKIDASLPDEVKKDYIRLAFNQGQIVWLDEVNSTLDGGFEKWINGFLSGYDPDTGKPAQRPGFMLIVTANSMGMEGRVLMGPAFKGRLTEITMVEPDREDLKEIISHYCPKLNDKEKSFMARDIYQLMQEDKNLTLRDLVPKLAKYARFYHESEEKLTDLELLKI